MVVMSMVITTMLICQGTTRQRQGLLQGMLCFFQTVDRPMQFVGKFALGFIKLVRPLGKFAGMATIVFNPVGQHHPELFDNIHVHCSP